MKRTGVGLLVILALAGVVAGFLVDQMLSSSGRPTFTPSLLLPILFAMLAVVLVVLALPIRRATRGGAPIDPFRAVRIAMLAKASSLVGAGVAGFGGGLLAFLLTRPVPPSLGSVSAVIAAAVGGLLLAIGALVAEHLCTIRKDDDDEQPGGDDEPGFGLSHHH